MNKICISRAPALYYKDRIFSCRKINIAFAFCICYNANRQRNVTTFHANKTNPRTVVAYSPGVLLFFYRGKAPTRLFVVLIVPVKPFTDEMANHASCNSHQECDNYFHPNASSRCQVSVGQHQNPTTHFSIFQQDLKPILFRVL